MRPPTPPLRSQAAFTLALLGAEFVLGMVVNLYAQIPSRHPGSSGDNYFVRAAQSVLWALTHGPVALVLHTAVGLALVASAVVLCARAIRARQRGWIGAATVGLLGVIAAGFNGGSFLTYNGAAISSLLMSVGFAVAVTAYVIGVSMARADNERRYAH